jgi:hypothetical protein
MGRGSRRRFSIEQQTKLQTNPWFPQTGQWSEIQMGANGNRGKPLHLPVFSSLTLSSLVRSLVEFGF